MHKKLNKIIWEILIKKEPCKLYQNNTSNSKDWTNKNNENKWFINNKLKGKKKSKWGDKKYKITFTIWRDKSKQTRKKDSNNLNG